GCAEARNAGDVLGPGAQASLLSAALDQRLYPDAGAANERTDTLGRAQLVARNRQKISAQHIDIAWNSTSRLNRIDVQQAARFMHQVSGLANRLEDAGLVVGVHQRD